jgi:hypothetical protein
MVRITTLLVGIIAGGLVTWFCLKPSLESAHSRIDRLVTARQRLTDHGLPVVVRLRHALTGGGMVLTVQNISSSDLPISAEISRSGTPSQTRELIVPASGVAQIGGQQGWSFAAGDSVTLHSEGFRDWRNPSLPKE